MPDPKITVLLPVYQAESFLREAVDSILAQTHRAFELLAIDDGSRDGSAAILASYQDPRLLLHRHETNRGLIATLNEGLELADADYVARMDADDVAHPERLARQVRFLESNPEVAVLGTEARQFGQGTSHWRVPHDPAAVRARLLFSNALAHSSVMLRAATLRREGLRYDPDYPHAEDYALWSAVAARAPIANLPETLLRVRVHTISTSVVNRAVASRTVRRIRAEQLARLGLVATDAELDLHEAIATGMFDPTQDFLARAERWLRAVRELAPRLGPGGEAAVARETAQRWGRVCRRARALGLTALRQFRASPLSREAAVALKAEVTLGALAGALRSSARGA